MIITEFTRSLASTSIYKPGQAPKPKRGAPLPVIDWAVPDDTWEWKFVYQYMRDRFVRDASAKGYSKVTKPSTIKRRGYTPNPVNKGGSMSRDYMQRIGTRQLGKRPTPALMTITALLPVPAPADPQEYVLFQSFRYFLDKESEQKGNADNSVLWNTTPHMFKKLEYAIEFFTEAIAQPGYSMTSPTITHAGRTYHKLKAMTVI